MVTTDRARELFSDARGLYSDALDRLAAGDIRDAAEKAWAAAKRATDALILERTGEEPQSAGQARRALLKLSKTGPTFNVFQGQYNTRSALLHVNCFYDGNCEPEQDMADLIRETNTYIHDAERLT